MSQWFGLDVEDLRHVLTQSDLSSADLSAHDRDGTLAPKGFWRVDSDIEPELRLPVLAIVALCDILQDGLAASAWALPSNLRLSDYGLGQDDRAKVNQKVAAAMGTRFLDWQIAEAADEARLQAAIHASNLQSDDTV